MQMAGNAIWNLMFLILWVDPAQAPNNMLLPCSDSSPPCIYNQPLSRDVCRGENVSISTVFELTSDIIPLITTPDITIYGNSQAIITGLSNNPLFQGEGRWRVSQMLSKETDKTGVLTVIISISDVQPADEFMVHIKIQMGGQALSTPDEIWFVVDNNCSLPNISQPDETRGTKIIDKFDASIEHLESTGQDIKLEFHEFIAELRSNVFISHNKTYSFADVASLILKAINISTVVLVLVSIMFTCMVVCVSIWYTRIRPAVNLRNLKDCQENRLETRSLIERKGELELVSLNKMEKNVEEMLEKVNQQMDDMNDSMALLISWHRTQGTQIMDGLGILERTEETAQKGDSTGIYKWEQMVMKEQGMGRSDGEVEQKGNDSKASMIPGHIIHDKMIMDGLEGMDRSEEIISKRGNKGIWVGDLLKSKQ